MNINPAHMKVGKLFGDDRTFRVPKYQRHYAWQADEIADLKNDLKRCLDTREANPAQPRAHFFGGLVTVRRPVPGSGRQELEVVDGQQRLATFVLLVAQLRRAMTNVAAKFEKDDPDSKAAFLAKRVEMLEARFQRLEDSVGMEVVDVPRLTLSGPDREFFMQLTAGLNPATQRESHEFLKQAYAELGLYLDQLIEGATPAESALRLEAVASVLEDDWTVLHMETTTQSEAYTLFQVLNDRGRGLTEGELLRAKTLELLDKGGTAAQRAEVEGAWDDVLAEQADKIEANLRWIYASHSGKRPAKAQLFDDLLKQFFPSSEKQVQTPQDAEAVATKVGVLRKEAALATRLLKGEWPYDDADPSVTAWDRDRLRLLTVELEHSNCMPLLIAATQLDQGQFAQVVQLLERFVFRYKLVVNAHIAPASSAYHKHAVEIRQSPKTYKVDTLKSALNALIAKHAGDGKFAAQFEALQYASSTNNRKIKYALLTLDHYRAWYDKGANGSPTASKMLVYDFPNTTVEHVYPLNSKAPDPTLVPVANGIGNLALLGPKDNDGAGNKDFKDKKDILKKSEYSLTRDLASLVNWDKAAVEERGTKLKDMALKVFSL